METKLPFIIGEQYENYEFDLNEGVVESINDYEFIKYELIHDAIKKYGIHPSIQVSLYFNADILGVIELKLTKEDYDLNFSVLAEDGNVISVLYSDNSLTIIITHIKYLK
ncbi:MAG: hypothetical protein GYB35_09270 [Algicola sp.]|nr:hypothetical protein [Algicola sp.]